jgi:hypothetical protein
MFVTSGVKGKLKVKGTLVPYIGLKRNLQQVFND